MRAINAAVIRFKREKDSQWERGLGISTLGGANGEVSLIVDMDGKIVPMPIWNFDYQYYAGAILIQDS